MDHIPTCLAIALLSISVPAIAESPAARSPVAVPPPTITPSTVAVGTFDVAEAAKTFCDHAAERGGTDGLLSNCNPRGEEDAAVLPQLTRCRVLTLSDDAKVPGTTLVTLRCVNPAAVAVVATETPTPAPK